MIGATTLRRVAGDVHEFTLDATLRTNTGWSSGRDRKTALTTLPVGQTAVWAYISLKSTRSRITTTSAHIFFLFLLHIKRPPLIIGQSGMSSLMTCDMVVGLFFTPCPEPGSQRISIAKLCDSFLQEAKKSTKR